MKFTNSCEVVVVSVNGSDDLVIEAAKNSTKYDVKQSKQKRILSLLSKREVVSKQLSTDSVQDMSDSAKQGFINFLMRNRHGTPFEMPDIIVNIDVPIFVSREQVRHRMSSINEASARYSVLEAKYYIPPEGRSLVQIGKPSEYMFSQGTKRQRRQLNRWLKLSYFVSDFAYRHLLKAGITREIARLVNPVGMHTKLTVKMNLRAWMNYLNLRIESDKSKPQFEIQQVAKQVEAIFAKEFPFTYNAFIKYGRVQP